ncbi:MBL fold metallo-hydrolase [Aquibacillus rhizosphaerae]|uniref:MBL fold metallo-hydrolase n=1 Tax=Aquibacillus rhizosphaerae TaxID=3051431 RepID=A0ABT7L7U9_9BACI|nr:MBL fold metallo-hydrolase [Aquibacillus sp. LR5S19]MDL4841943.1 MBL fold metallo-hydrolase [Aquibacillus sp. LR5S19]
MENSYEDRIIPVTSITSGIGQLITPDVYCLPIQIVNICFVGEPNDENWVIVDAGMPRSSDTIIEAAEKRYGSSNKPAAIILTHGHFDHVGAITDLIKHWDVPVFSHKLELPYLTGKESYPEGDSTVDGGLVSEASPLFPNHSINLENHVQALPDNGKVPFMNDWRWIHTPGHTKGHISLFRDTDQVLIAGDAFVTVKQESLYKVITQQQEISGPPKYFTTNWQDAWESVKKLNDLKPAVAITGHGVPMSGEFLSTELEKLSKHFDSIAIPEHGRFVH